MNPISLINGLQVTVHPDTLRRLPDEVIPGVPWPEGFKEEIDAWMASFFKPKNLLPDGQVYVLESNKQLVMNPRTFNQLKESLK